MEHDQSSKSLDAVFEYHELSKHHVHRYAPGPGYLDWANQPNPFRRYEGAEQIPLKLTADNLGPRYGETLARLVPRQPLTLDSVSQLFQDSLGLSAWKSYQDSAWALRVNPSSGNLHPTEGYLICAPMTKFYSSPVIAHYAPKEHLLEVRVRLPASLWEEMATGFPENTLFVALSSIYWREAWKYGERAFRYCHHDVGHAIAAVTIAASVLGWHTQLLPHIGTQELESLLGLKTQSGPDREHPDCLLAIFPKDVEFSAQPLTDETLWEKFDKLHWLGIPNELSPEHVNWRWVEHMAELTRKPFEDAREKKASLNERPLIVRDANPPIRQIIHKRRSAVAFDGMGSITAKTFYSMLESTLPAKRRVPFEALPWEPKIHFLIFAHRVEGLSPGLYLLLRNQTHLPQLKENSRPEFTWKRPEGCPQDLPLFFLLGGDAREVAREVSCMQDIASDGCFSLGMIADFEEPIRKNGAWFYPRLFWESGLIGQVLYLEAEVAGIRSTGIGCFLDDPVHDLMGLKGRTFQSLYHFTVGYPVEDTRLITAPPYSDELRSKRGYGRG